MRLAASFLLSALLLTGCGTMQTTSAPNNSAGIAFKGVVHGGQQAISGAHIYLMAANSTGYGGNGMPPATLNQSTSLLNSSSTGLSDGTGAYVLTDSQGSFSITGDYQCTAGQQVYLLALGGDSGGGPSNAIGLMAALGTCPAEQNFNTSTSTNYIPFIWMNEVTTVAAAFSFAGFATDATHVSSQNGTQSLLGIKNAFANANNLVDIATGAPLGTTPAGNGTVPTTTLNTLANILAACINTNGAVTPASPGPPAVGASNCYTLFANATSDGTSTGTQPSETATAAINIAHFPSKNVAALFGLQPTTGAPFMTDLPFAPQALTLGLKFTGGGVEAPQGLAVDSQGQVWIFNGGGEPIGGYAVSKLASSGAPISGSNGYPSIALFGIAIDTHDNVWLGGYLSSSVVEMVPNGTSVTTSSYSAGTNTIPFAIAFDPSGNIWVDDEDPNTGGSAIELTSSGGYVTAYTSGGIATPYGIASDATGNIWLADNSEITGGALSGITGEGVAIGASPFTARGLTAPHGVAVDRSNHLWLASYSGTVVVFDNSGNLVSPAAGYGGNNTPSDTGGISAPYAIAIDGDNNAWIADSNINGAGASEFSNSGTALNGNTPYGISISTNTDGIALDPSGNVWLSDTQGNGIIEIIGGGAPTITPTAAAIAVGLQGTRPPAAPVPPH